MITDIYVIRKKRKRPFQTRWWFTYSGHILMENSSHIYQILCCFFFSPHYVSQKYFWNDCKMKTNYLASGIIKHFLQIELLVHTFLFLHHILQTCLRADTIKIIDRFVAMSHGHKHASGLSTYSCKEYAVCVFPKQTEISHVISQRSSQSHHRHFWTHSFVWPIKLLLFCCCL